MSFRRALVLIATLLAPMAARAQVVRGTVSDSVGQRPVPGAVVSLLDTKGDVISRYVTGNRGEWQLPLREGTVKIRVVRIGFRPRESIVPAVVNGVATSTIRMVAIPTFLEPMRVDVKQCPKRDDSGLALGLWEQVRSGLLASIVSREQNAPSLVLLGFSRVDKDVDKDLDSFKLTVDSTQRSLNSYRAVRTATEFIALGFASSSSAREQVFYAPDAEVLVDEGFAAGYCFRILRDRSRPTQVGLGFSAPDKKPGRVDVDGALWVDTIARSIKELEYRYLGIHPRIDELKPGGRIAFMEVPNGLTFIENWSIRLVGTKIDTVEGLRGVPVPRSSFYTVSTGGEIAHARWPDSTRYDSRVARLSVTVRNPTGSTAIGRTLRLVNTPYEKTLDPSGMFEAPDLLPGPYKLVIREPRLDPLKMDSIPTRVSFEAKRGQTQLSAMHVPTLEDWVLERCGTNARIGGRDTVLVLGRVLDSLGRAARRASYSIDADYRAPGGAVSWFTLLEGGRTGEDGLFELCTNRIGPQSREIRVYGKTPDGEAYLMTFPVSKERLTLAPVLLDRVIPRE